MPFMESDLGMITVFFLFILCNFSITCVDLSLRETFIFSGVKCLHKKMIHFRKQSTVNQYVLKMCMVCNLTI